MLTKLKQQLMIPQLINAGLESLFNKLITSSQDSAIWLRKLDNKVLKLHFFNLNFDQYFVFSPSRIEILSQYEGQIDCEIQLAPSLVLKMPKKSEISHYINDKSIILTGDLQILQDFLALIESLEKDPAELLAPYVGDVVAQSAVDFLQSFQRHFKQQCQQSQRHWGERLTEEWQLISPSLALADFAEQVKLLEKQTALLADKITQLENQ